MTVRDWAEPEANPPEYLIPIPNNSGRSQRIITEALARLTADEEPDA